MHSVNFFSENLYYDQIKNTQMHTFIELETKCSFDFLVFIEMQIVLYVYLQALQHHLSIQIVFHIDFFLTNIKSVSTAKQGLLVFCSRHTKT